MAPTIGPRELQLRQMRELRAREEQQRQPIARAVKQKMPKPSKAMKRGNRRGR